MPRSCLLVFCCVALVPNVHAQVPVISPPFPMGVQRGETLEFTLTGKNLQRPMELVTSFPATVEFPPDEGTASDGSRLRVRMKATAHVPLGWHWLRLRTAGGLSNLRLFCVDDLPQVLKQGSPHEAAAAQTVPVPSVVCGTMVQGKTDYFKIHVNAGQRLAIDVLGRRLGTPLDPQVAVLDPKTLRQLAFSDDSPGQNKDPRLTYVFKEAGEYLIELRDVRYQGGGDWHYRMRLGDFPIASATVPLAVQHGQVAEVGFAGPAVDVDESVQVQAPDAGEAMLVWPRSRAQFPNAPHGWPGWPVQLRLSSHPELVQPNAEEATVPVVPIPGAISGRFLKPGQKNSCRCELKQGQRIIVEAETHQAGLATNVYFVLNDPAGKQVAASNPAAAPARIDFTAPADGSYTLVAEHLHYNAGPEEAYRLVVRPYRPGFGLQARGDALSLPAGSAAVLLVDAQRRDFNGPIQLEVVGPAGFSGAGSIAGGQNVGLVLVLVHAEAGWSGGAQRLEVIGTAKVADQDVRVPVRIDQSVRASMSGLPHPPRKLGTELAVGVLPPVPFRFEAKYLHNEGVRGLSVPVTVQVTRNDRFEEEINFSLVTLPPAPNQPAPLAMAATKIEKGKQELSLELKPAANAPDGLPVFLVATAKVDGVELPTVVDLPPLKLGPPVVLRVDAPPEIHLQPKAEPSPLLILETLAGLPSLASAVGQTQRRVAAPEVRVAVTRKGGYQGPVVVELKNLPAGVQAGPMTIPEGQAETAIPLSIAPGTAPLEKKDVQALGTAPGAANQQSAPVTFTLKLAN